MKQQKGGKWKIVQKKVYCPEQEERLRKAYEIIVPEITLKLQECTKKGCFSQNSTRLNEIKKAQNEEN